MRVLAAVESGARVGATTELSIGGPKQRFVLARLLAEPNRVISVDRLVDGLWGDDPPETARHTVQAYISELRKALGSFHDTIAVALSGRRADSTFDDLIARGVESAAAKFGLDSVVLEPPYTDDDNGLRRVADGGPALMFGAFFMHDPFLALADEYPDTTFVLIDYPGAAPAANVVAVNFADEQGSFLVGAAAALESATGKVGYIGANSQSFIEAFRAGFEQGAVAADPDVELVSELIFPRLASRLHATSGYSHPEQAHRIATAMFDDGVDIIFVAAGGSYSGVIEAATELSRSDLQLWVIGVDTDQYYDITDEQRAHLVTSMFKRLDLGVEAVVAAHDAGTLAVPGMITVTMADGGVGYTDTGGHLQPRDDRRARDVPSPDHRRHDHGRSQARRSASGVGEFAPLGLDGVDETIRLGLVRSEPAVAFAVGLDLLQCLTRVQRCQFGHPPLGVLELLGLNCDIGGLAAQTGQRLVHHDASVGKCVPLAGSAGGEQELSHRGGHAHADRCNVT